MTAPVRKLQIADSLESFVERCKAKALAWQVGEISLHDAVDAVQQTAEAFGLGIELGQDAVQAVMVEAFLPLRTNLPRDDYDGSTFAAACREADEKQRRKPKNQRIERLRRLMDDDVSLDQAWEELNARASSDIPKATLDAAEYLIQLGDLQRWRKWFDGHRAKARTAILQHLEHLEERKGRRGK